MRPARWQRFWAWLLPIRPLAPFTPVERTIVPATLTLIQARVLRALRHGGGWPGNARLYDKTGWPWRDGWWCYGEPAGGFRVPTPDALGLIETHRLRRDAEMDVMAYHLSWDEWAHPHAGD